MIRIQPDGTREGFLIDWDLSRIECELGIGPVEPDRTVRLSPNCLLSSAC